MTTLTRDRTYLKGDRHRVGTLLVDLAEVQSGVSFRFTHAWNGSEDAIATTWSIDSDPIGRQTDHVFRLDSNATRLVVTGDGSALSNRYEAIGRGGDFVRTSVQSNASMLTTHPLLQTSREFPTVRLQATLDAKAELGIARGRAAVQSISMGIHPDRSPGFGGWSPGDRVTFAAEIGMAVLEGSYRLTQRTYAINESNVEAVGLAAVAVEVLA